jgi:hypothetical protein
VYVTGMDIALVTRMGRAFYSIVACFALLSPVAAAGCAKASHSRASTGASPDAGQPPHMSTGDAATPPVTKDSATPTSLEADSGLETDGGEPPVGVCYSPTEHADLAYVGGASGCTCTMDAQAICVSGAALICMNGRWHSVVDGPCYPRSSTCASGQIVGSASACLAAFRDCYQLPDGRFCGVK